MTGRPSARQESVGTAWRQFRERLKPPYALQDVLLAALEALSLLVPSGDGFYAYAARGEGQKLTLRVTRTGFGMPEVSPDYAGLVHGPTPRAVPLEVEPGEDAPAVTLDGAKSEPFLTVACGRSVLLRIAVDKRYRLRPLDRVALLSFAECFTPTALLTIHAQVLGSRADDSHLGATTSRRAMEMMLGSERLLGMVCSLGADALAASVGYLATWLQADTEMEVVWKLGDMRQLQNELPPRKLVAELGNHSAAAWSAPAIPQAAARMGLSSLVAVPLLVPELERNSGGARTGILVIGSPEPLAERADAQSLLRTLSHSVRRIVHNQRLTRQLSQAYLDSLTETCQLIDDADPYNRDHSGAAATLARRVGQSLGLPESELRDIELAARLHDVGMAAVTLGLANAGRISDADRQLVRIHPGIGADLASGLPESLAGPAVSEAIRYHHERWDGGGYPSGLAGEAIPLAARIVGAAEQYLGRTSNRSYRRGMPPERALYELERASGTQLDPQVVRALVRVLAADGIEPKPPDD